MHAEPTAVPISWPYLVRLVAADYGLVLSDDEVSFILWEHTGFPCFWEGDPVPSCVRQLHTFFANQPT
jgi:hypothetical protein